MLQVWLRKPLEVIDEHHVCESLSDKVNLLEDVKGALETALFDMHLIGKARHVALRDEIVESGEEAPVIGVELVQCFVPVEKQVVSLVH